MEKIKLGIIGLGLRGHSMLCSVLSESPSFEITAVCDVYPDRVERASFFLTSKGFQKPLCFTSYEELLASASVDAVYISTSWETHLKIATEALYAHIAVALEVGGASSFEECLGLIEAYEKTKTPFMFMENCCFGKTELLATALVRDGLLGDIVHCSGAYSHDLRYEVSHGNIIRHYRLNHYLNENCENYPTHEFGPILKILGLTRGNRPLSLVSMASSSKGLSEYINTNRIYEKDPSLKDAVFSQADIVHTIIKCEGGESVLLKLDTTLPRSYSREFTVRGTKGLYEGDKNLIFLDGDRELFDTVSYYSQNINNAKKYEDIYVPELWKLLPEDALTKGHGGMDYIEFAVFADKLLSGKEMPIDVYEAATLMAVSYLSAESIRNGSTPVAFPDFTNGAWRSRPLKDGVDV